MKKQLTALLLALCLILALSACGKAPVPSESAEVLPSQSAGEQNDDAAAAAAEPGRQDGERFEAVIVLEGMEETVLYEHVVNEALGFAMDYDCESFVRTSGSDRERFSSVWEDAADPQDYLELSFRSGDPDTVAEAVRAELAPVYELYETTRDLDGAGEVLYIEASVLKGTNNMADTLRLVYIIPAGDGCLVAEEHLVAEASEGFGRRFAYMLDTLTLLGG